MGLIQFCLSAPKTDMENNVVVSDYAAMDRILREERKYILGLCKKARVCSLILSCHGPWPPPLLLWFLFFVLTTPQALTYSILVTLQAPGQPSDSFWLGPALS